jgi:multidrug efflux pump subunit AcrA (membrane-fusion protein)
MITTALLLVISNLAADPSANSARLTVPSAQLTLIEQVLVPAREAGVLVRLAVREGELVETGRLLAVVEDDQAPSP